MRESPAPRSRPAPALYPPLEPRVSGRLAVDSGHLVYWEECGNADGQPALFLHSGPGGGAWPESRRWFDPRAYRIVVFDQRGCGRSRPHASLAANTTERLLGDVEALRRSLGVARFLLFGGSWGATLALAYATRHPGHVAAMVLRGVFTGRRCERDWLYREGASRLFPEAWSRFNAEIPEPERDDLVAAYHARLVCGDPETERRAARAWCAWEDALMTPAGAPPPPAPPTDEAEARLLALARIESYYARHAFFLEEGQLLREAARLRGIPGVIVQGADDAVTPPATAEALKRAWPDAELRIVAGAGHAACEPALRAELIRATDRFRGDEAEIA